MAQKKNEPDMPMKQTLKEYLGINNQLRMNKWKWAHWEFIYLPNLHDNLLFPPFLIGMYVFMHTKSKAKRYAFFLPLH